MTSGEIVRFYEDRPFQAFTIITADGRELDVRHPEQSHFDRFMETVSYFFHDLRLEVIDTRLIVSLRTIHPIDIARYTG